MRRAELSGQRPQGYSPSLGSLALHDEALTNRCSLHLFEAHGRLSKTFESVEKLGGLKTLAAG
jgi:hypothetical protein